jgi:hypothetical protein
MVLIPRLLTKNTGNLPVFLKSAPGGIRTPDPLIRSQILYPLSYGRKLRVVLVDQVTALETDPQKWNETSDEYPLSYGRNT